MIDSYLNFIKGKYQGVNLKDIKDKSYLLWILKEIKLDDLIRLEVEKQAEGRKLSKQKIIDGDELTWEEYRDVSSAFATFYRNKIGIVGGSIDHIFSVKMAFDDSISIHIVNNSKNLKKLTISKNSSKGEDSFITKEKLLSFTKCDLWEEFIFGFDIHFSKHKDLEKEIEIANIELKKLKETISLQENVILQLIKRDIKEEFHKKQIEEIKEKYKNYLAS